jgi:hypothetical protein
MSLTSSTMLPLGTKVTHILAEGYVEKQLVRKPMTPFTQSSR